MNNLTDAQFYEKIRPMFGSISAEQVIYFNKILESPHRESLISAMVGSIMHLSDAGVKLIADFEGLKLKAYLDSVGIPTIGIGTIRYPNGVKVKIGDTCTEAQAYAWFKDYVSGVETFISKVVKIKLNQNQFDALVSLIYNIGNTAFTAGSVDDKLNAGNMHAALTTWAQYTRAGGKVVQGLVNRRNAEIALFKKAV